MDELDQIKELKAQGYFCSQIIMLMGLELQGKENPDLIKAMNSLAGGIGFTGHLCGALTGAAAWMGLYAGKGSAAEEHDDRLDLMLLDLVDWFKAEVGQKYNGIDCDLILENNRANIPARCPGIVQSVFQKAKELLVEYGYDLSGTIDEF
jgi:C_GCAxxG_C_C family probable redox protein